ncbi:ABC transporter permease [Longibacter salinarum]|uniref:ABC transporter permease n=1 Tax=Longibacter salinarum TaxID=1850348 RepID=A0A2A8CZI8_9BACT|nr:iron ABC transporter permease [Longibacter salinarum]PEN14040.1 ABC transporter permease [Longibacter salinarum]
MIRKWLIGLVLVVSVAVTVACGVAIGSTDIALLDVVRVIASRLGVADAAPPATIDRIIWDLRMPRVVLAMLVGGGLSIIGVAMQTLVRNPLAEPYILGISGGATAGASLFYLGFLPPVISKTLSMPVAAFAGGLATIVIVYLVARTESRVSVARLLLAGVAMSALTSSITSFITFSSPEPDALRAVLFWLLGSFSGARWALIPGAAVVSVVGAILLTALARPLDAMLMGEEPAYHLGVPVESLKRGLLVLAALVTGVLVSTSGAIGFVGLIIPHAVRMVAGVTHRTLVPASFLTGGLFMVWADLAARTLLPAQELPVGILTALCGVPFFLWLLRQRGTTSS